MLDQLQGWWQLTTPEMQAALQEGGLLLAAVLGGHFVAKLVTQALSSRNFDAALCLPGPGAEHGITPTLLAGLLVRLTIWAVAGWWLAHKHGRPELANLLGLIINRTWALTTVLVGALALGSLLARRVMHCLRGFRDTSGLNGAAGAASSMDAASAVGTGVYLLVVLLALIFCADVFDWPLTRTTAMALWQFAQHLLIAVAALVVGCLGARWARDLAASDSRGPDGSVSPQKQAGQYTALGIMAATTVFAVAVLLTGAALLIGLAALAVFALVLWMFRGYLPDVTAGLQLRAHRVREVELDGAAWRVSVVGLLSSQLTRAGEFAHLQNRQVLDARMHAATMEPALR
jgi:hypothetical protein